MGDPEADVENEVLKIEQDRQVLALISNILFLLLFLYNPYLEKQLHLVVYTNYY